MEVCWSPNHEDKFYLFGANLTLYRISEISCETLTMKDVHDKVILTSDNTKASLMCTKTDPQFKCVAWRPDSNPDHLLAFGLNSGKVVLSSFGKGGSIDANNLIGKEFSLRHPRACLQLDWNPYETHLLAEVTERHKSDPCILLWDIRFSGQSTNLGTTMLPGDRKQSIFQGLADSRPILELGTNESCSSLSWFTSTLRTFICGMNGKSLRIYDVRAPTDSVRCQSSVATKAVHSLTIDKISQHRVASFVENQLCIWDTRKFTEPITVIQDKLNYSRIVWCPTRSGLLACSHQESSLLKLFDFYMSSISKEDGESVPVERYLKPSSAFSLPSPGEDSISSFAWHPKQRYRLLSVTPSGLVSDFYACDRLPMAWSPDLNLTFAHGASFNICSSAKLCTGALQDVSIKMRNRACNGYGIKTKLAENLPLLAEDKNLYKLWTWMSSVKIEHKFNEAKHFAFSEPFFSSGNVPPGGGLVNSAQAFRNCSYSSARLSLDVGSNTSFQMPPASLPISPTTPHVFIQHNGYHQQQQQWGSTAQPTSNSSNILLSPSEQSPGSWLVNPLSTVPSSLAGVMSIFPKPSQIPKQALASEMVAFDWLMATPSNANPPSNAIRHRVQVFKSPQRIRAIELCGWEFGHDSLSMPLIDKLESQHQYVRAAALATFTVRMMRAIELLIKGAQNKSNETSNSVVMESGGDLNVVAMALSGYTGKEGGLWTSMCSELTATLRNPYLKALFQFLTSEDVGYEAIIKDSQLELSDRVAFACLHLQDKKLLSFLERQSTKYIEEGDPQGLLLTGLTENGVQLLSNYVDFTGDVQSAVAIVIQGLPELDLSKNSRVKEWIEAYRNLLNNMRLWTERAEFDVFYRKFEKVTETFRQTHLSCTYCSKAIVTDPKVTKAKGNALVGTHMKPRIQSCPHCRKPLARCAICMLYMGTASGIGCPKSTKANLNKDRKLSRISEWFTWCQTCLHGGHVDHMIGWFKTRNQCPVSGCKCRCDQLDMMSKIESGPSDNADDSAVTENSTAAVKNGETPGAITTEVTL